MPMFRVYNYNDIEAENADEAAIEFDEMMRDPSQYESIVNVEQWPSDNDAPEDIDIPGEYIDIYELLHGSEE